MSNRTQETVVGVGLEELFWPVQVEAEGQEDFHVGFLLQQPLINVVGILQLANADCVIALPVALGVEWVEHLESWVENDRKCTNLHYLQGAEYVHKAFTVGAQRSPKGHLWRL